MTLRHAHMGVAVCAGLLGLAHLLYGINASRTLSAELVWFMGAGIAMIVTALSHFAPQSSRVTVLQSGLMLAYLIAMVIVLPLPQVWLGLALFAALTVLAFTRRE